MTTLQPVIPDVIRWRCKQCGGLADLPYSDNGMPMQPPPLFGGSCAKATLDKSAHEHVWLIEHSPLPLASDNVMWQCFHCGMPTLLRRGTSLALAKPPALQGGPCRNAQPVKDVREHLWVMV